MSKLFADKASMENLLLMRMRQVSEMLTTESGRKAAIKVELSALLTMGAIELQEPIDNIVAEVYDRLWRCPVH